MAEEILVSQDIDPLAAAAFLVSLDQLQLEPDMTPMKLQKLLYIAQANYLASTKRRLFDDRVEAFEHGPLVYRVWREYQGHEIIRPQSRDRSDASVPKDIEHFLLNIWAKFGSKSASWLRRYTHEQDPWFRNYEPGSYRRVISDEDMCSFYQQRVPASERVMHESVVTVPAHLLEPDSDAETALRAFLRG